MRVVNWISLAKIFNSVAVEHLQVLFNPLQHFQIFIFISYTVV